ncbi:MAG: ABC transporter permease, partial [Acidimicrobiia bacterium]|nr:ABC transporter permease [Acidimicrobiia bacterium]
MRTATRIAGKDLKLRLRDRSALIIGIIAPLALAFIFKAVFGGAFDPTASIGLNYGIVDLDRSTVSAAFNDVLIDIEAQGILELDSYAEASSAESAVENGDLDAYFLIDAGFGNDIATGSQALIEVVGSVDAPVSTQIAESIARQYATGIEAAQLGVATTAQVSSSSLSPDFFASLVNDPSMAAFTFELKDISAATRQLDATTYFAAGMAVFFLFFTVQFGVLGLLEEEREGTMTRLRAAPIGRMSVVAGKAILAFALGIISMTVLVISTQLLLGASWGAPLGVGLLVVAG